MGIIPHSQFSEVQRQKQIKGHPPSSWGTGKKKKQHSVPNKYLANPIITFNSREKNTVSNIMKALFPSKHTAHSSLSSAEGDFKVSVYAGWEECHVNQSEIIKFFWWK